MLIVIDFETYYDAEYTLKKMTTEEYVTDPRFEAIGVSIKIGDRPTKFHRADVLEDVLRSLPFAQPDVITVSHNALFDMRIMARYGIYPSFMADTRGMSAVTGMTVCAGGGSLDVLATYCQRLGLDMPSKGHEVQNMIGVHAADMTPQQWNDYGAYCVTDTDICRKLYDLMRPYVPDDEMDMMHVTLEMFTRPVFALDVPLLEQYAKDLVIRRTEILTSLAAQWGVQPEIKGKKKPVVIPAIDVLRGKLRSAPKFAEFLKALGVTPPIKRAAKSRTNPTASNPDGTPKMTYAFAKNDPAFMELMELHPDERVRTLCDTRMRTFASLADSRAERFIKIGKKGLLPIPLLYAGAHTLRYSGMDRINVQNLPTRGGDNTLRRAIIAPPGQLIIGADSSQIECRVNAYTAGEKDLLEVFGNGGDPYCFMAASIYNLPYDQIYHEAKVEPTKEGKLRRMIGKETVLACGYQMAWRRFQLRLTQQGVAIADTEAQRVIEIYRGTNTRIVAQWASAQQAIKVMAAGGCTSFGGSDGQMYKCDGGAYVMGTRMAVVCLPNGTALRYKNLRMTVDQETGRGVYVYDQFIDGHYEMSYLYGGKLVENVTQALAFAALKFQCLNIVRRGVPIKLNVHDEWVTCVPKEDAARCILVFAEEMRRAPPYLPGLPFDCEVDVGYNYGETTTIVI